MFASSLVKASAFGTCMAFTMSSPWNTWSQLQLQQKSNRFVLNSCPQPWTHLASWRCSAASLGLATIRLHTLVQAVEPMVLVRPSPGACCKCRWSPAQKHWPNLALHLSRKRLKIWADRKSSKNWWSDLNKWSLKKKMHFSKCCVFFKIRW